MKTIFIFLSLIIALFLEWSSANFLSIFDVSPPIFAAVIFFWFWRISYSDRMWLAIAGGIILDTFSIYNFGLYIIILFLLSLLVEYMKFLFFSQESRLIQTISIGIFIFLFLNLPRLLEILVNHASDFTEIESQINIVIASVIWSLVLPLGVFTTSGFLRRRL